MSKRDSSNKTNFDGIDPQKSLIKSLESIKSLLKQGDSKINEARENIARADSIGSDTMETRLSKRDAKKLDSASSSSNSLPKPNFNTVSTELELDSNFMNTNFEEIILDALPENNIFNNNLSSSNTKPYINPNVAPKSSDEFDMSIPESDNTELNDLYDHDLIVPMLEEIVIPEDQDSSLFNMDSSVEINIDSSLNDIEAELDEIVNGIEQQELKSSYNEIKKTDDNTKADILTFELNSNPKKISNNKSEIVPEQTISEIKISKDLTSEKNNLKDVTPKNITPSNKISKDSIAETKVSEDSINDTAEIQKPSFDKPSLNIPRVKSSISLVEDSHIDIQIDNPDSTQNTESLDHVVIKETTQQKMSSDKSLDDIKDVELLAIAKENAEHLASSTAKVLEQTNTIPAKTDKNNISDAILTPAIESVDYTDGILSNLTGNKKNNFSDITGLDTLNLNTDKLNALQKRVEMRVHNRLIELIVDLDEEIKEILSDEIKHTIQTEKENNEN